MKGLEKVGGMMVQMERAHETETWTESNHVYYQVTVTATATASPSNHIYGFTRKIPGHTTHCQREIKHEGTITRYCPHSHISEAEALSLVRKGQGSVYRITQIKQRLK